MSELTRPAHSLRGVVRALVATGALLVAVVASAAATGIGSAYAAPKWNDGALAESQITNCASIIQGTPYTEFGAGTYVGFNGNSATLEPYPGEVYYVHIVIYGLGNACAGQRARVEFTPPANTTLAISAANKVYCFADGTSDPSECPQTLLAGAFGGAYFIPAPTSQPARTWPLPVGHNWEFQVPVMSSVSMPSGVMRGYIAMADGNFNPTLTPTSSVLVYSKTPSIVSPSTTTFGSVNWPTTVTSSTVQSTGVLYPYGVGGGVYFDMLAAHNSATVSYSDGPAAIATGSTGTWSVAEDWIVTGHALVASHTYYWRLRYVTSGGVTYTGPEQSFTTPPTSGGTSTIAATTTTTTMPTIPGGGSGSPGSGTTPPTTPAPTTTAVSTPTSGSTGTTTPSTPTSTTAPGQASSPGTGSATEYLPIVPGRLLDTRQDPGSTTIDGLGLGHGVVATGDTIELQVTGRAGVPADASAVVLNVTVTGAQGNGFVTVYPCGAARPTTSNLNFSSGQTIPNAVIAKIGAAGKVCLYTNVATHLLADINGYFPAGSSYAPIVPGRILDTRQDPGTTTIDGLGLGHGLVSTGDTIELQVTGRAGVPNGASAAVLNVTVTGAQGNGFVTVYPCGAARPTTSNLNFSSGQTIPNAVIAKIGDGGKVCLFTNVATHLLADVNGYFPAGSTYTPVIPGRVLDTRQDPGTTTIDGVGLGHGIVGTGDTIEVQVAGRAGVPNGASAVVLNVTVTGAQGNGFVTVYPCGADRPTTSNLNFSAGQTIPNAVIAKVGVAGTVCLYTNTATHLLVDTNGYFPA